MHDHDSALTSWQLVVDAGQIGSTRASEFARRYGPVVRAYLATRWRTAVAESRIEDAMQDVFVECFRQGGVLSSVTKNRPRSFRGFLLGVTRNVARRIEKLRAHSREAALETDIVREVRDPGGNPRVEFERKWARSLIAAALQDAATSHPEDRVRELFELKFQHGLPIRDIAARWQQPVTDVHRIYARARRHFQESLKQVVAHHDCLDTDGIEEECRRLLQLV